MSTLIPSPPPAYDITTEDGSVYTERLSAQFVKWQREDLDAGTLWYVLSETGGGEENFVAGDDEEAAQRAFSAWASGADQDETGWEEIEVVRITAIEAVDADETPDPTEPAWVANVRKWWAREGKNGGDGITKWTTPPACQGQIVVVSYAASTEDERVYRCVYDQSDRTEAVYVTEETSDFEPWNTEPSSVDGEWYRIDVAS